MPSELKFSFYVAKNSKFHPFLNLNLSFLSWRIDSDLVRVFMYSYYNHIIHLCNFYLRLQKNIDFLAFHCQINICLNAWTSERQSGYVSLVESKTYQALFSWYCAILKMSLLFNFMRISVPIELKMNSFLSRKFDCELE